MTPTARSTTTPTSSRLTTAPSTSTPTATSAPTTTSAPTSTRTSTATSTTTATPAATATPASTEAAPPGRDDPAASLAERWRGAVEEIEQVSPFAAPALKQAALLWIRDGEVGLQLPQGTFADMVERRRAEIEAALARRFGKPTRLAVTLGAAAPAQAAGAEAPTSLAQVEAAERMARSSRIREVARAHQNIQAAARILDGRIDDIEEL